ncbi:MAG: hypothetical protein JWL72_4673 [Ilumatobacteraceae bacterium]|nr:hypothetical protein [Ilumatobacteraceae bacterium]
MHTNLRVDGANCPLCFNDLLVRIRSLPGISLVESSISEGCIAVDHDDHTDLVALIGSPLHGIAMASNEIVMTSIDPVVAVLQCGHHSAHQSLPSTVPADHRLETVTDALTRLRADGYTADFEASHQGSLSCRDCDRRMNATEVQVDHTIRFEGATNPDDQDIVFAICCACGCKGTYSAAYGSAASPEDTAVLQQLALARHAENYPPESGSRLV